MESEWTSSQAGGYDGQDDDYLPSLLIKRYEGHTAPLPSQLLTFGTAKLFCRATIYTSFEKV